MWSVYDNTSPCDMPVIKNRILPIGRGFAAINLFGIIFVKCGCAVTPELINHERIHTRQMLELLVVPFYVIYVLEWLTRTILYRGDTYKAYRRITFENEAYAHGADLGYLSRRRPYAMWRRRV